MTNLLSGFTSAKLTERIRNAREQYPLCVLYRDSRKHTFNKLFLTLSHV